MMIIVKMEMNYLWAKRKWKNYMFQLKTIGVVIEHVMLSQEGKPFVGVSQNGSKARKTDAGNIPAFHCLGKHIV